MGLALCSCKLPGHQRLGTVGESNADLSSATRFPEKKWPGKFDVYGTSHQIFHVLVVCGAVVHLCGVWSAYGWNYRNERSL